MNKLIQANANNEDVDFSDFASPSSTQGVLLNKGFEEAVFDGMSIPAETLFYNGQSVDLTSLQRGTVMKLIYGLPQPMTI